MEADLNGDCVRQTFVDKEVPVNASLPIMIISQMFFLFQRDDILDIQALEQRNQRFLIASQHAVPGNKFTAKIASFRIIFQENHRQAFLCQLPQPLGQPVGKIFCVGHNQYPEGLAVDLKHSVFHTAFFPVCQNITPDHLTVDLILHEELDDFLEGLIFSSPLGLRMVENRRRSDMLSSGDPVADAVCIGRPLMKRPELGIQASRIEVRRAVWIREFGR